MAAAQYARAPLGYPTDDFMGLTDPLLEEPARVCRGAVW
jgi:hypothetical protein